MKLEKIKELLRIDLTSPSGLRWNVSTAARVTVDDCAGTLRSDGYYRTRILNNMLYNHRIIYALHHNLELDQLPKYLDHIDRNPSNNDPANLREATNSQNMMNINKPKNNTSGVKGVYWNKERKKWQAQIKINGIQLSLGRFDDKEDAAKAYEEAALKYHGEFASL